MTHPIATTHNGKAVYVDLLHSLAGITIAQQPHLAALAKEVLGQTRVDTAEAYIEQDMQRTIGYDYVIETSSTDNVFYAKLQRDPLYTRFVKSGKPAATTHLSLILHRDAAGAYELRDVWIGKQRPARPGADDETAASQSYWATHAFILEGQSMQSRSVTHVCPYETVA